MAGFVQISAVARSTSCSSRATNPNHLRCDDSKEKWGETSTFHNNINSNIWRSNR